MSALGSMANLSAVGILAIVSVMYFLGLIVPGPVHKDMRRQRDYYEEAYRKLRDKYEERLDTRLEANTEALTLVQHSFESIADERRRHKEAS